MKMTIELSDIDLRLLSDIINDDPSFDLTSVLFKIREDLRRRKVLLESRTKMLYDLMKSVHWRVDVEDLNTQTRMSISARIDGKYLYPLQQKLLTITEGMIKLIDHGDKIYMGIDIYNLGHIYADKQYIQSFLSDLKQLECMDDSDQRKGFIHY